MNRVGLVIILTSIAVFSLCAQPAQVATAPGTTSGYSPGTTSAISTTGATMLSIQIRALAVEPTASVSDSLGNTWCSTALALSATGFAGYSQIWYTCNPSGGLITGASDTATVTSAWFSSFDFTAWSGVGYRIPLDKNSANAPVSAGTTVQPGTLTPTYANSLVLLSFATGQVNPTSCTGGFTTITSQNYTGITAPGINAYLVQGSATAANPTCTAASSYNLAVSMAVFVASTAPVPPNVSLKTYGAPSWTNWTSLRAGCDGSSKLDASGSYSNVGPTLNHFWQQLSGPSIVSWSSRTTTQPTLCGLVFGGYVFQDTVTDSLGSVAAATLELGSTAQDSNGVVIQADPNADSIFGPMMAFGKNPWAWEDNRLLSAYTGQSSWTPGSPYNLTQYTTQALQWTTPAAGTIAYLWGGIGNSRPGEPAGTTLSADCGAAAATCTIVDASQLPSLAHLPTLLSIGNSNYTAPLEYVVVTSTTATSGAATLTFGYDGRGVSGWPGLSNPPMLQVGGTKVGEYRIYGTGTKFVTDSARPICPSGAPGPPGAVAYTTGTVSFAAANTAMAGSGTAWAQPPSSSPQWAWVRIQATHASGTPFILIRGISLINNGTSITLDHAVPADIDTGVPFNYKITSLRYVSMGWLIAGNQENMKELPQYCGSDTDFYAEGIYDISPVESVAMSGEGISIKDDVPSSFGATGANFYGASLGMRAGYYRSGFNPMLNLANAVDEHMAIDPEIGGGYLYTFQPLNWGGLMYAGMVDAALNKSTALTFNNFGGYIQNANNGYVNSGCNGFDTRDGSIMMMANAFAAKYASGSVKTNAQILLTGTTLPRQQSCAGSNFGFESAPYFSYNGYPSMTMTANSTAVTGTSFTSSMCYGTSTGTMTVTNGSASYSGPAIPATILVTGTKGGKTYIGFFFQGPSSSQLSGLWPGDSGTVSYMLMTTSGSLAAIGSSNTDPMLYEEWGCIYNSPTSLTLNRTWDGPSGSGYYMTNNSVTPGIQQQPFMLGGWGTQINRFGSQQAGGTGSAFQTIVNGTGSYMHDIAYDSPTQAFPYISTFGTSPSKPVVGPCPSASVTVQFPASAISETTPGCESTAGSASQTGATQSNRVLTAEAGLGAMQHYLANPTVGNKTWMDTIYGSLWGSCPYTQATYYCDSSIPVNEDSDNSLSIYKWAGFFFGVGGTFSNSWPAIRIGGALPAQPRTVTLSGNPPMGGSMLCNVTAPSGAVTAVTGSTSCVFTVDDRQGTFYAQTIYKNSGGSITSTGENQIIY